MYLDEIDDDDDQQFDDDNDEDVAADLEAALKQTDDEGTDAGDVRIQNGLRFMASTQCLLVSQYRTLYLKIQRNRTRTTKTS